MANKEEKKKSENTLIHDTIALTLITLIEFFWAAFIP